MTLELPLDRSEAVSSNGQLVQSLALLTPIEVTQSAADRAFVERAKGMLMLAYDVDSDNAFELLRWGSQAGNVTIDVLARRLTDDLAALGTGDVEVIRAACDDVLFQG